MLFELGDGEMPEASFINPLEQVAHHVLVIFASLHDLCHHRVMVTFRCLYSAIAEHTSHDIEKRKAAKCDVKVKHLDPEGADGLQGVGSFFPRDAIGDRPEERDDGCIECAEVLLHVFAFSGSSLFPEMVKNNIGEEDTKDVDDQDQEQEGPEQ